MHVTRLADARPYEAAKHFNMTGLRLQGFDASPAQGFWVGLSHFLPNGGAEGSSSPLERVYVVVTGEVTVITDDGETVLGPMDSCYLAPGERREIINRTNQPASMLVVMPYPEGGNPA
ncbi:MAG: cupin domain-containing protein [Rhodobiaceae bacterium]|nr:cupin domain-containing protein [Rhodobiaceae bacterium]